MGHTEPEKPAAAASTNLTSAMKTLSAAGASLEHRLRQDGRIG
jgi:hypothetical protein